jgi:arylformamidase
MRDVPQAGVAPVEDEHEQQYNPRVAFPNFAVDLDWRRRQSEAAKRRLPQPQIISYGSSARQLVELYRGDAGHPTYLFIHGGAWRAGSIADYTFIVPPLLSEGNSVALLGYRLAPEVTLTEVVADVRAGFDALAHTLCDIHGQNPAIRLCGHSAGAQLGALLLCNRHSRPKASIVSALLVSGVYDLAPMAATSINRDLHLTNTEIENQSPLRQTNYAKAPVMLAVGERETRGFIDFTKSFARHLAAIGTSAVVLPLANEDHFSITRQLAERDTPLSKGWRGNTPH